MRMLLVITEQEALPAFERALLASDDAHGFTIAPRVYGRGKSGLRAGSRAHPGASSMIFSVVADGEVEAALRLLREVRDRAGVRAQTKMYSLPVEEVD